MKRAGERKKGNRLLAVLMACVMMMGLVVAMPLAAGAAVTGTAMLSLNKNTGVITPGGLTAGNGSLAHSWMIGGNVVGTDSTFTPTAAQLGAIITYTGTDDDEDEGQSADITVYKVAVTPEDDTGNDSATIADAYAQVDDTVDITYVVDNSGSKSNTVAFSGGAVTDNGSPAKYTVAAADAAANGVITLTATFTHEDKTGTTLAFAQDTLETTFGGAPTHPGQKAVLSPEAASVDGTVAYTSSAVAVATVDANGALTIVGVGTTTITATYTANNNYDGATDTYTFTVNKAPLAGTVVVTGTPQGGGTLTADVTGLNETTPANLTFQWKANGADIAGETGTTYAVQDTDAGKVISVLVTAAGSSAYTGAVEGRIEDPVAYKVTFAAGSGAEDTDAVTGALGATVYAQPNTGLNVGYTLSNGTADGTMNVVNFTAGGRAFASASTVDTATVTYTVNANDAVDGVIAVVGTFVHSSDTLLTMAFPTPGPVTVKYGDDDNKYTNAVGFTGGIPAGTVAYTSSNTTVAANPGADGVVTINAVGLTVITATYTTAGGDYAAPVSYVLFVQPRILADADFALDEDTFTYNSADQEPVPVLTAADAPTLTSADYDVVYTNNRNAGTATAKVTFKGNYGGTLTKTFTIEKATPTITTPPTATGITYGRTLADATLNNDGVASTAGAFAWADPTKVPTVAEGNAGLAVTFTPDDEANYNTAAGTVVVAVAKATPTVTFPSDYTLTYGQTLADAVAGTPGTGDGTFAFSTPTTKPAVSNSNSTTYPVVFTPTHSANYETKTDTTITVTVTPASIAGAVAAFATQTYTGSPLVPPPGSVTLNEVTLTSGTDYDVKADSYLNNTNAGVNTASVVLEGKGNYTGEATVTFTIEKATPTITTAPTAAGITYGKTLADATLSDGVASTAGTFAWTDGGTKVPTVAEGAAGLAVTFTPEDAANYNTVTTGINVTIAVAKAAAPADVSATYGVPIHNTYNFSLTTLLGLVPNMQGLEFGAVTYTIDSATDGGGVLASVPATEDITGGNILPLTGGTAVVSGQAVVVIDIASANFEPFQATVTLTGSLPYFDEARGVDNNESIGVDTPAVFTIEGNFAHLETIILNDTELAIDDPDPGDLNNYPGYTANSGVVGTVQSGSIVITLTPDFLAFLGRGSSNTLQVSLSDGVGVYATLTTTFNIAALPPAQEDAAAGASANTTAATATAATTATSPQTGDESNMTLWVALLALAAAGGAVTTLAYRRKAAQSRK